MSSEGWIVVVESRELWTASLRTALRREESSLEHRLVRAGGLDPRTVDPDQPLLAAVEVRSDNLAASLNLFEALRSRRNVAAAALLDRGLARDTAMPREIEFATLEAGARLTIHSPRGAVRVVRLALRWFRLAPQADIPRRSEFDRAIARLPWQPTPTGLR